MLLTEEIKHNGKSETRCTSSNLALQDLTELGLLFDQVEASFRAIASQYQLPHRRLLALDWVARYHGISTGTFKKAFEMWLESMTAEGEIDD
ncbi:hypothetical protein [Gloeocapsopsis dulcis]|uniref:Uncharacterized protein n=1 Tax=Gloeocapsopsis dulcis AAB1 = 1H9 TaxID=1433147 RepID=A0A6N8FT98_9CHRO|nr:hypothetical protein [Gloeocapsopsis dulcis]MUL36350.1 hypothetical protein [Gloeocapsopsis dulcis AAB1 = 1H9]WNN88154.1 hypothetical protein P0S91_17885 [Gloeocapsopsis dulcis]